MWLQSPAVPSWGQRLPKIPFVLHNTRWVVGGSPVRFIYAKITNKSSFSGVEEEKDLQKVGAEWLKASNVVCAPDIVAVLLLDYSQPLKVCNEWIYGPPSTPPSSKLNWAKCIQMWQHLAMLSTFLFRPNPCQQIKPKNKQIKRSAEAEVQTTLAVNWAGDGSTERERERDLQGLSAV